MVVYKSILKGSCCQVQNFFYSLLFDIVNRLRANHCPLKKINRHWFEKNGDIHMIIWEYLESQFGVWGREEFVAAETLIRAIEIFLF
jgi:hypothetical protein